MSRAYPSSLRELLGLLLSSVTQLCSRNSPISDVTESCELGSKTGHPAGKRPRAQRGLVNSNVYEGYEVCMPSLVLGTLQPGNISTRVDTFRDGARGPLAFIASHGSFETCACATTACLATRLQSERSRSVHRRQYFLSVGEVGPVGLVICQLTQVCLGIKSWRTLASSPTAILRVGRMRRNGEK